MITIRVSEEMLNQIRNDFSEFIIDENVGYILYIIKTDKFIITAYNNKKGKTFNVTIQGENSIELAKKYISNPSLLPKKEKKTISAPNYLDIKLQIGSDEVGTGDFLGPVVVCAAYSDENILNIIKDYKIDDSKKIKDEKILEFVPLILKKIYFEVSVLSVERYNNAKNKGYNLNQIKAILHNNVLTKLHKRFPAVQNVYVDKFCSEEKYFSYLENAHYVENKIIFKEKGESYFPSVALASCIARYYFLQEINKLNVHYKVKIPLGAGENVDRFSKAFINKFGIGEFNKIAKTSFANYKKVLD